jgi:hypothetical protein
LTPAIHDLTKAGSNPGLFLSTSPRKTGRGSAL